MFLLVAVLSYSRRVFVKAFLQERQDDWREGIAAAFTHFGGLMQTVLGDMHLSPAALADAIRLLDRPEAKQSGDGVSGDRSGDPDQSTFALRATVDNLRVLNELGWPANRSSVSIQPSEGWR